MDKGLGDKYVPKTPNRLGMREVEFQDMESERLGKSGDGLPNSEDILTVQPKEILLDERGGAVDLRSENSSGSENISAPTSKTELNVSKKPTNSLEDTCYLPDEMWEKILEYVEYEDLKSMRGVCTHMNSVVVPNSTRLIRTSCLIFDGNVQLSSYSLADLNEDNVCSDFTHRILPYYRIRNTYISKNYELGNVIDWMKICVKTLELTDCVLHWMEILDVLNCFECLEEFKIFFNPATDKDPQKDFLCSLTAGLKEGLVLEKTSEWQSRYENSDISTPSPIPTLKIIRIELPFIQCVNVVLRILEHKCKNLESLSLTIDRERMEKTNLVNTIPQECRLEAGDLLLKNVVSLKKITLNLIPDVLRSDEYFIKSFSAVRVLHSFFEIRGLNLEELIMEVPMLFRGTPTVHEGPIIIETLAEVEDANEKREFILAPFLRFLTDQMKSLKVLRLSKFGWYPGADKIFQKKILGDGVDVYTTILAIGGSIEDKPNWTLLKDKMDSLEITWHGVGLNSVPEIFKGNTDVEPFEKVHSFTLRNIMMTFKDFDLPFLLAKFPNLTCLKVIDQGKSTCVGFNLNMTTPSFNYEIHDCIFQMILKKLPNLHTLHLDCCMEDVSDFGLTGISENVLNRMKSNKCYRIESGDQTGHCLTGLKRLKSLKLLGFEKKVTNASVWLAFRNLPLLKELVIVGKQKITDTAKTYLKNLLEKRMDFHLEITKPIEKSSWTHKFFNSSQSVEQILRGHIEGLPGSN